MRGLWCELCGMICGYGIEANMKKIHVAQLDPFCIAPTFCGDKLLGT